MDFWAINLGGALLSATSVGHTRIGGDFVRRQTHLCHNPLSSLCVFIVPLD
jgi:hypothetical protein